ASTGVELLLAVLRVSAVADVALLQEARREEERVVPLRDRLRRDQVGGLLRAALRGDEAGRRNMPSLDEVDRRRRGRGRELADVLEHRHRLPARDDGLNALRGRGLAADGDRVQLLWRQRGDDR